MSDTTTVPTLTALGWDDTTAGAFDDAVTGSPLRGSSVAPPTRNVGPKDGAFDLVPGRVGRVDRGRVTVHTTDGPTPALVRLPAGSELEDQPTTGDWVGLERRPDGDVVRIVLPRSSAIVRKAAGERSDAQVMAANLDHVLVAVPFETRVNLSTIERYLVVAWESGAQPLVVLTKCDLAYDPDATRAEVETAAPGVEVHVVSAETGEGVDVLAAVLSGGTTALVGQSGAGKSTLVNVLAGEEVQLVSGTRQDGKGRHTTTARELIVLTGGGVLIDTPGLRSIGLHDDGEGVALTFPDVEELIAACRFADCAHETEPGCAVQAALASGELDERRWHSWGKLQREAAWIAMRTDPAARAAARKRWAATGRSAKAQAALKRGRDPFA
ncbi:ribosome small subunit-dependent GTPase A [Janibacter indicus]|uniref:Small ribosomal subunit biogenesis GTPase RsgA n=1 Tax=Janibacter indicus TaxID=857417 RepID=A0A7L9J129_9MICO|nr:ribosome small subunit-dependent GTPase A [Janibacter indicus]QOK22952.1 ribosome small subunit-dependent GTPase A [Janibacter indicus]